MAEAQHPTQISSHIVDALRSATDTDRVFMHFQPLVSVDSLDVVGYEALARIRSPKGEIRHLSAFLHGMATSPLMWDLDRIACANAFDALKEFRDVHVTNDLFVSSNVACASLGHTEMVPTLLDMADARGLTPRDIVLEIDGGGCADAGTGALSALEELIEVGATVILDRFGTDRSTLAHLESLPLTGLKIDRSIVSDLDRAETSNFVAAAVDQALDRDLRLFASGVETQDHLDQVRELGIDTVQGWLFAGAMPLNDNLLVAQAE